MSTARKHYWNVAVILILTGALSAALGAAQKGEWPEVLYQRAVQKDQVDGDQKAAVDLYKQVVAAPGVTSATKAKAQARLSSLTASAEITDRIICSDCGGNSDPASVSADGRFLVFNGPGGLSI